MNRNFPRALALAAAVVGASAHAAVDAAALAAIGEAASDIATVGGAVFLVMVGIKLVKWIRRAL